MSLGNVVIDDADAVLADIEAHQVGPDHQRPVICLAGLFDHIVNGWLGVILVAQQHDVRVDGQFRVDLREDSPRIRWACVMIETARKNGIARSGSRAAATS